MRRNGMTLHEVEPVGAPPRIPGAFLDVDRACTRWLERRGMLPKGCPECGCRYRHSDGCGLKPSGKRRSNSDLWQSITRERAGEVAR